MSVLALNSLAHINVSPWVWSQEEGLVEELLESSSKLPITVVRVNPKPPRLEADIIMTVESKMCCSCLRCQLPVA